jgi:hypothetical protein
MAFGALGSNERHNSQSNSNMNPYVVSLSYRQSQDTPCAQVRYTAFLALIIGIAAIYEGRSARSDAMAPLVTKNAAATRDPLVTKNAAATRE